jgi:predicted transcriptional regulator
LSRVRGFKEKKKKDRLISQALETTYIKLEKWENSEIGKWLDGKNRPKTEDRKNKNR